MRHDPITGNVIGDDSKNHAGDFVDKSNDDAVKKVVEEEKENENARDESCKEEIDANKHEPHLGAVRNTSGIRCIQPPGGKSNFTLG